MKKRLFFFTSILALSLPAFSQQRCAAHAASSEAREPHSPDEGWSGLITIPLVVHVVWNSPAENISDAQIQSQVEVLNRDFRATNVEIPTVPAVFAPDVADMEIEFCLVAITRTQTGFAGIANLFSGGQRRVCHSSLGGHDALDSEHYLNAWVSGRSDGACGEGSFPDDPQVQAGEQGIFVRPDCFGTLGTASAPFNLGRTATHETGHYLSLKHLWGNGLEDPFCQSDDMVEDTEEQAYSYAEFTGQNCPVHPSFSCGSADMFMNFMNLPADRCMSFFTKGQKERARAAIQTYRPGLLGASCLAVGLQAGPEQEEPRLLNNPAAFRASLFLPQKDICEIAIFDAAGRLVFIDSKASGNLYHINLHSFIAGAYYVKIRDGQKIHIKKLIIAR